MRDRNEFDFDDHVLVGLRRSPSWTSDTVVLLYDVVASCGIYSLFPHTTPHCHIVLPTGLY